MDDYAGRVLADRYRLPLPPSDAYELAETRAFDTYSGQEVLVRQVPLPEVVDAEVIDADGSAATARRATGRAVRRSTDPAVRRAIEAAQAAAQVPDHPRLDQVFDVFAEAGSLWIVSELVAARPLAALLAERPLNPYRAAEIGSDVLTALRVLHAHGWTHRNITIRTVLVCDDGRVVLTGLAAGAAEEALCGYVPVPQPDDEGAYGAPAVETGPTGPYEPPSQPSLPDALPGPEGTSAGVPAARPQAEIEAVRPPEEDGDRGRQELVPRPAPPAVPVAEPGAGSAAQLRAARAGAIAAYRAGARAAARANEGLPRDAVPGGGRPGEDEPHEDPSRTDRAYEGPAYVDRPHAGPAYVDEPHEDPSRTDRAYEGPAYVDRPHAGPAYVDEPHEDPSRTDRAYEGPAYVDRPSQARPQEESAAPPAAGERPRPAGPWGPAAEAPYAAMYEAGDDEDYEDEGDGDDDGPEDGEGPGGLLPPGRRVHLAGTWGDGPGAGRSVPAGGSAGSGEDALRADSRRMGSGPVERQDRLPQPVAARGASGGWDAVVATNGDTPAYRGPATPLAAERARQARIAVVGAVTERWAPEQAGPVHDNWQLAPPIGPSTDLWALGALLYRAVQGHAPYPEENAAELVQMVCAEPPAFAEDCGPLRPVVESLLRQDPTERPDFEELRGWLRSLVRSAPEPEAGTDVVPLPPADVTRLPVVRRRGELVRRRRGRGAAHGRHRQGRPQRYEKPARAPRAPKEPKVLRRQAPPVRQPDGRTPRRLGRLLLGLILLLLAAVVVYAVMFMPEEGSPSGARSGAPRPSGSAPAAPAEPEPEASGSAGASTGSDGSSGSQQPQTSHSAATLAPGHALRKDPEGFEIGVPKEWQRSPANADRQIRYGSDGFSVLIVPGRDTVKANGTDPLDYQRSSEPELKPFRESSWATSTGLRRVDVGRQAMAEGQFTWQESGGREVYVRNMVMIVDGRYHIIQAIGPESERDKVSDLYEQAISTYRVTS
ncbi:protein kinase [Streptomyces sp. B1I3]|uniref:protein kinase n=1 Tax=Streptomyces sp. B1I3 TaxID=3042264 RepID=UPI00278144B2|nr:protein kinase [Streptomyces sp. B1I3]MDQ0794475.1 serine/threonine protein kinase [Streptomyces sp. B1I3]